MRRVAFWRPRTDVPFTISFEQYGKNLFYTAAIYSADLSTRGVGSS